MTKLNSTNVYVNMIVKRDQIRAWHKENGNYLEGSGHWDDKGSVYLSVTEPDELGDIVLNPDEWHIYVMVPFKKEL